MDGQELIDWMEVLRIIPSWMGRSRQKSALSPYGRWCSRICIQEADEPVIDRFTLYNTILRYFMQDFVLNMVESGVCCKVKSDSR